MIMVTCQVYRFSRNLFSFVFLIFASLWWFLYCHDSYINNSPAHYDNSPSTRKMMMNMAFDWSHHDYHYCRIGTTKKIIRKVFPGCYRGYLFYNYPRVQLFYLFWHGYLIKNSYRIFMVCLCWENSNIHDDGMKWYHAIPFILHVAQKLWWLSDEHGIIQHDGSMGISGS